MYSDIHTYTYIHTYIHTYINIHTYVCMYVYGCIYTHTYIYTYISYMHTAKILTIQLAIVAIISYLNKVLVISQNIHSVFTYKTERGSQNYWTNRRIWL